MSDRRSTSERVSGLCERAASLRTDGPSAAVVTGTSIAVAVLVAIALRYAPEYLRVLGVGPALIGAFGSVGIAADLARSRWRRRHTRNETDHERTDTDRRGRDDGSVRRPSARTFRLAAFGAATIGLALWVLVPSLVAAPILVWAGAAGGLVLVAPAAPLAFDGSVRFDGAADGSVGVGARDVGITAFALPVGFLVVGGLLALVPTFTAGFRLIGALGVALGLVALSLVWVESIDTDSDTDGENSEGPANAGDSTLASATTGSETHAAGSTTGTPGSITAVRTDLRALSEKSSRLLLGDTLLRATSGAVSVFLVIAVTSVLGVEVTALGLRFRPDALFALLVAVEALVLLVSRPLATRLTARIGPVPLAVMGALAVSLVPIALVNAPANPAVLAALFAVYGLREVGRRAIETLARDTLGADADTGEASAPTDDRRRTDENESDRLAGDGGPSNPSSTDKRLDSERAFASYRFVRDVAVVPSALVGGLLFAVSPQLAFGLATAAGLLGVRELLYVYRPRRN